MNNEATPIAQKIAEWWTGLVNGSHDLAVNFAPVPAPIPLKVSRTQPTQRGTSRVINVLAYMDDRQANLPVAK